MSDEVNNGRYRWSVKDTLFTITIVVTVSGLMLGAYWNMLQNINIQQVALAGYEARLVLAEKQLAVRAEQAEKFEGEMRAAISVIKDGVAELRVQEATRKR